MRRCIRVRVRLFYARAASGHLAELVQITVTIILLFYLVTTPAFISKLKDSVYVVNFIRTNSRVTKNSTEEKKPLPPLPDLEVRDGVWQPVDGTRSVYVYAAYVELRVAVLIRVIAVTTTPRPPKVLCRIWLPEGSVFTINARVQPLRQKFTHNQTASFVVCLPRTAFVAVIARNLDGAVVSIIEQNFVNMPPTNLMHVVATKPIKRKENDVEIHVCVEPISKYSQDDWLMEWFAFNRLLNVAHFYMYTESISERMKKFVSNYKGQAFITERPWNFPFKNFSSGTISKLAAANDCLYRSMEKAHWVLFLSVDQLVIPRRVKSFIDLIGNVLTRHSRRTAFLFQNVFFYRDWQNDSEYKPDELQLVTSQKTTRILTPNPLHQNSTFMILPHQIVELATNYVVEMLPSNKTYGSIAIPPQVALLHNYQKKCLDQCLNVNTTLDRTAHNWTNELSVMVLYEMSRLTLKIPKQRNGWLQKSQFLVIKKKRNTKTVETDRVSSTLATSTHNEKLPLITVSLK